MSTFPHHVDTIIVGTGLTHSILAAACSRIGKTVVHLDENDYYGNYEASFTFQQLINWIKIKNPHDSSLENIPQELTDKSRMFSIDLTPKLLFSNGEMVDLLVKSNVARYHEFKNNIRILCLIDSHDIHVLPIKRNEVFISPLLSNPIDKRRLMKFIEACLKHCDENNSGDDGKPQLLSEIGENSHKPIGGYLEERGLKPVLRQYIMNSIAMVPPTETTREACERIRKFMFATEKYGKSPFLFPLYGCGEFPQSFCRMSAVFGGVYCLNTRIKQVKRHVPPTDGKESFKFVVEFGEQSQSVTADMLVVERQDAVRLNLNKCNLNNDGRISRAILITNRSVVDFHNQGTKDLLSFLRIPPTEGKNENTVYLIELDSSALVCPEGFNIVYLWTKSTINKSAEDDIRPTIDRLYTIDLECILWRYFYHQPCKFTQLSSEESCKQTGSTTDADNDGLFVTSPEFDDIDYTSIIRGAEALFKRMCPGHDFLPRAPDPEEIIHSA